MAACAAHSSAFADRSCEAWHAELVSVEGTVEVRTPAGWLPLASGDTICTGDSIRVKSYSRAALRLPDKTVLRLDQDTSLTFSEPEDDTGSWLDVLKGVIHVISRDPRALRFNTPYANAGLEGTEFVIAVKEGETDVTVLEGEVMLSNEAGAVGVPSGERGSARFAQAPQSAPVPNPVDVIGWTPYYVPVLKGDLPRADHEPTPAESRSADFHVRRGASRLSVGRVSEARSDLDRALGLEPDNGSALALLAIAALGEKDHARAMRLAEAATEADPATPAAWLALSYVREADFRLEEALRCAETAARIDPGHAFALARLAELQLAAGHHSAARETAQRAIDLRSDLSHPHAVMGFGQLSGETSAEAAETFRRAIRLAPNAPLPRLGLGLALARQGDVRAAREQVEIAVVLDPTNALSRSYMAKIYDAERRDALSESQLQLAKELGQNDPTAWLYDALRKQSENRPVEALHDLRKAIDLNGNRGIYRSRLMVDEDLAARSAGVGRLHTTLGFEQLALLQGWTAVTEDPGNYSGHRLLADVYSYLPRHQIARVDELFQSQLMQPLNMTPVRPQLAESNLFILDTAGPSGLAFHEFQPLLPSNGLTVQGSAVVANRGTAGFDAALAGLHDKVSYSVGHFDFQTDGFRPNNDLTQEVTNAFVQFRPRPETGITAELRSSRIEKGDLQLLFDPEAYNPDLRQRESLDSIRFGLRQQVSERGTLLAALVSEDIDNRLAGSGGFELFGPRRGHSVDTQYLHEGDRWHLTAGGRHLSESAQDTLTSPQPISPLQESQTQDHDRDESTLYAYGNLRLSDSLAATVGASLARVEAKDIERTRVNPKLGITWRPDSRLTLRAAAFRTLRGPLVSKYNIRPGLEPTHVAGFNQRFFGAEGELAWHYGTALDYRLSEDLSAGVSFNRRDLQVPAIGVPPGTTTAELHIFDVEETMRRAYLYWTPSTQISAGVTYQYERFDNAGYVLSDGFSHVRTHRVPFEVNYFHRSGFSAGLTTTFIDQAGEFGPMQFGEDPITEHGEDQFWIADLSLSYRLPSRRGQISLNVHNLFDEEFRFQDTDPENPRILPERMLMLKLTVSY